MKTPKEIRKMAKDHWERGSYAVAESLMDFASEQEAAQQSKWGIEPACIWYAVAAGLLLLAFVITALIIGG